MMVARLVTNTSAHNSNSGVRAGAIRAVATVRLSTGAARTPLNNFYMNELEEMILKKLSPEEAATKTAILGKVLSKGPAEEICDLLPVAVGNLVGNIPDRIWERVLQVPIEPCPHHECTCHIIRRKLLDALDETRDLWKQIASEQHGDTE